MHLRVEQLPEPQPDYRRFVQVLRRAPGPRVPLIELAIHPRVVDALLGEPAAADGTSPGGGGKSATAARSETAATLCSAAARAVRLQHRLGYDVVRVSAPIPFPVRRLRAAGDAGAAGRPWTDEHAGPIATRADLERFAWPTVDHVDFGPLEAATAALPEGMRLIGFAGGVLEFAMDLLGMTRLMVATRREPELVAAVIEHVGRLLYGVFENYCDFDSICALWLGDDLGHKHGLLISAEFLERHVVPWYRRFADLAHARGRPFVLHTCGDTRRLMPALLAADIDAKHSFEDAIQPVERFMDDWGARVAVLGGVDVHLLATGDAAAIRRRTLEILEYATGRSAATRGGTIAARCAYAAGSGNSIPDYVPAESYLAMIEAVGEFNSQAQA